MHSFVVVAAKPGRAIPPHVLDVLRRRDLADLTFFAEDHLFWTNEAGNVAFGGWCAATDVFGAGTPWHVGGRGLTAFSGHLWPKGRMWTRGEPWASQLEQFWQRRPMAASVQQLDGIHAALSLSASGEGALVTDPLSLALLYRAETTDLVAYATRASLAARVAAPPGEEPARDPLGVGWLTFLGYSIGERTGFAGTTLLPLGCYVELSPAWGSRLRWRSGPPWAGDDLPAAQPELVDRVHEDLVDAVRSAALLDARHRVADITGGKDSRLILALLLEEGLADRFEFRTIGAASAPDATVARDIAARFDLTHEPIEPAPMDADLFRRRVGAHVFQTSGVFNTWDLKGGLGIHRVPKVSGLAGETLRTFFGTYPLLASSEELVRQFHSRSAFDTLGLLRPDVRAHYDAAIDHELVGHLDSAASTPQDHLDAFYVRGRLRRWFGAGEERGEECRVFPLYSLLGLQAAFALGATGRRNQVLHFEITRRACPELAKMAFAGPPWPSAAYSHLPDARDYDAHARADGGHPRGRPGRAGAKTPTAGAVPWQATRLEANRDVLERHLLDEPTNPVFDILDPAAVRAAVTGPMPTTTQGRQQLYGALTAALWLGHHETAARSGTPVADADADGHDRAAVPARSPTGLLSRIRSRAT